MFKRGLRGPRGIVLLFTGVALSACGASPPPRPSGADTTQTHFPSPTGAARATTPLMSAQTRQTPAKRKLAKTEARPTFDGSPTARKRALLITEVQALENLATVTPAQAADRPVLMRRIAQDYAELEAAAENEGVPQLQSDARAKAITTYTRLVNEHPGYPQKDEAMFSLAHEYELGGDLANARRVYYQLLQVAPSSRFVPFVYVDFGDIFFDEAEQEPEKWALARAAYRRALEFPASANRAYGYAWYKLAWVEENQGARDEALRDFDKAIAFATDYAAVPGAGKLGEAARNDRATLAATGCAPVIPSGDDSTLPP